MARRVRAESRARYFVREQARRRGWDTGHVARGGDFLEENEIVAHFRDIGLGLDKPDFLICLAGQPSIVVEAKNDPKKLETAVQEACDYADAIAATRRYTPLIAVGAAGEEDAGFLVKVLFRVAGTWVPLLSNRQPLTTIPTRREAELALIARDATTTVSVPQPHEFVDAALETSAIMRRARVEAPLRPKVIGAITLAMYEGSISLALNRALDSVNQLITQAIARSTDLAPSRKSKLTDALTLSHADFDRLEPYIGRILSILLGLNIRAVLHSDTDFLGMFYEAFLRYGYDNNALGIVFTPRHITRLCVDMLEVGPNDRVIDIACGTGGFLVAAFDRMLSEAESPAAVRKVKNSIAGFDANPTVWSLAMLNMFFRGDGKSQIELEDSLTKRAHGVYDGKFTRSFLNPPFSQDEEPEYQFINAATEALEPGGLVAALVYASVFADEDHAHWREFYIKKHTLLAMISLPEDLFYPTSAPTTIMVARAHVPQPKTSQVFMARIWNDGFEKLKSRRVAASGSQLDEVKAAFLQFRKGRKSTSSLAVTLPASNLSAGAEWSPQQWLPQPLPDMAEVRDAMALAAKSIFQAVAEYPDVADEVLGDFGDAWSNFPPLPQDRTGPITFFFSVLNGRSTGEKNYQDGSVPYVSSGETSNSIVGLKAPVAEELFESGGLTVTAFGVAAVQPWPFLARGNGGSSVRVLQPRFRMSETDLLWFAAQINIQRWRFFYARMSIKSRLQGLMVCSPTMDFTAHAMSLAQRVGMFRDTLSDYSASVVE